MPRISFRKVDVFAFIDSDTAEAKQFTTYMVYWECLARAILDTYGGTWTGGYHNNIVNELRSRKKFRSLTSSQFTGDHDLLRKFLLNSWNSELGLYLVDDDDPRLMAQNQWNNVYAYYATGRAALAWLLVRDGSAPDRHRPLLRAMSAQVIGQRLFPTPWDLACTSMAPGFCGFVTPPNDVSNLAQSADCFDMAAKVLKTTRRKRIEERKVEELTKLKRKRAPSGLLAKLDADTEATTVFDFMWRSRTRANYGDPSMFYIGTLGSDRSKQYVRSVRTFTDATMLLFEALVAQKARNTLVDAAVHYISRDRAKITDLVLGRRLRALGLLTEPLQGDDDEDDDDDWRF
ncbi:MAG: hypothetical protein M3Q48_16550 [Actinomycetota bacterium]|nr:hypothetical protein [Actinomycetota bacterium]